MSIYDKESYSQSRAGFLAGPIEHWWDTPENPDMWNSPLAVAYRVWRGMLNDAFVKEGYLVYRPHESFKGPWNEKMQDVNDFVLSRSDFLVDMTPAGYEIKNLGTQHEVAKAVELEIPVFYAPFPHDAVERLHVVDWHKEVQPLAKFFVSEVDRCLGELLD